VFRLKTYFERQRTLGQSLVELALTFPALLILLSGVVEFGIAFNHYVNLVEATREGARYAVDGDPCNTGDIFGTVDYGKKCHKQTAHQPPPLKQELWCPDGYSTVCATAAWGFNPGKPIYIAVLQPITGVVTPDATHTGPYVNDIYSGTSPYAQTNLLDWGLAGDNKPDPVCGNTTIDYYEKIACVALGAAEPSYLDPAKDDIVISIYRVYSDAAQSRLTLLNPTLTTDAVWPYVSDDSVRGTAVNPSGLSIPGQWVLWGNKTSRMTFSQMQAYFANYLTDQTHPGAGVAVVEMFYHYNWVMGLPWLTAIFPLGLEFYTYTVVPVPAGEPQPTPTITPSPTNTPTVTDTPNMTATPTVSDTPTNAATPTATQTPTATPTLTTTPSPTPTFTPGCSHNPDLGSSMLSASLPPSQSMWANDAGWAAVSNITLTLNDVCGQGAASLVTGWPSGKFKILSNRNPGDTHCDTTTAPDRCQYVGENNGQYTWLVASSVVGTSGFTVQVDVNPYSSPNPQNTPLPPTPPPGNTPNWQTTFQTPTVNFTCLTGVWDRGYTGRMLQFDYTNPGLSPGPDRQLDALTLNFTPAITGTLQVNNIVFGGGASIIWTGPQTIDGTHPLALSSGSWNGSGSRSILGGTINKQLQFFLSYWLASSGSYSLTTHWTDGAGDSCSSAAVTYP
jgi:hypothetical protein